MGQLNMFLLSGFLIPRRADGLRKYAISSSGFSIQDGVGRHFKFFQIYFNLFRFILGFSLNCGISVGSVNERGGHFGRVKNFHKNTVSTRRRILFFIVQCGITLGMMH